MAVSLLFTGFTRHPKILRAGEPAAWLFVCLLEYCAENETDGRIDDYALDSFGLKNVKGRLTKLTFGDDRHGPLLHAIPGGYEVNDYLEWNRTAKELAEKRETLSLSRSAAGKIGAAKRWGNKIPSNANGKRHGKPLASGWQADSSVSGPGSSGGLDGPSTTSKGRATHPRADHHGKPQLDELMQQAVAKVCTLRPTWKPHLVEGAAARAVSKALTPQRAAIALLCVASDPDSRMPIRVLENGWWWDENDTRYLNAIEQMEASA